MFKRNITYLILFILVACAKEEALPVSAIFEIEVVNNDFSIPVEIVIFNKSKGAEAYEWVFEGGKPATSSKKNPGAILYEAKGEYTIRLFATNEDLSEDTKELVVKIDDPVLVDFNLEVIESNYPPVEVVISNNTDGATTYNWSFEGGNPSTSNEQNPGNVVFSEPGIHIIKLEVGNGLETHEFERVITVEDNLITDFDWEVAFEDDDLQVPVKLTMINKSVSATGYGWKYGPLDSEYSSLENPEIIFNTPGVHIISLTASNGKELITIEKEIEVFANTNLRSLNNIQLGINTAHNSEFGNGSFFSTKTRLVYKGEDITEENGADIDIVYFGLNNNFTFNKFLSPDDLTTSPFEAIANATKTKFINSLELCNCTSISVSEFDAMQDDTLLRDLSIIETLEGSQQFDNSLLPRIVLFENSLGIKGAIKIKEFVQNDQDSYLIADIKIQKEVN